MPPASLTFQRETPTIARDDSEYPLNTAGPTCPTVDNAKRYQLNVRRVATARDARATVAGEPAHSVRATMRVVDDLERGG